MSYVTFIRDNYKLSILLLLLGLLANEPIAQSLKLSRTDVRTIVVNITNTCIGGIRIPINWICKAVVFRTILKRKSYKAKVG